MASGAAVMPGLHEQRGGVDQNHVDAVDLREDHQHDADDHGQADSRTEQLAETAAFFAQFVLNLFQFLFGLDAAVDLRQHPEGFCVSAHGGQPAGAFGHEQQTDHQTDDRQALGGEHPSPMPAEREQIRHEYRQAQVR